MSFGADRRYLSLVTVDLHVVFTHRINEEIKIESLKMEDEFIGCLFSRYVFKAKKENKKLKF